MGIGAGENMLGGGGGSLKTLRQEEFEVNNSAIQNGDNQESINNKFNTQLTNINAYLVDFQERVRGVFTSLAQLNTTIPNPRVNDVAIVSNTNTLYYCKILNQWTSMGISQEMSDIINTLKGGVSSDGDSLKKLYDLIQINKNSIISIQNDIININSKVGNFFDTTADIDNIINKKDEIVNFLNGISETENLLSILLSNSTNDRNRANHTGTQDISTINNLQTNLDNKVNITRTINTKPLNSDIVLNKNDIGLSNIDNTSDLNKPISNTTQLALDNKQDLILEVESESEMLALTGLPIGYIVDRSDKSALFKLKALPSNQLQNWKVMVSTGGSVSIPSTAVEKIYTTGALPTTNGLYVYNGGTMPTGSVGDILKLENSVWTIEQTFENAPASIYSKFDGKTYNKKINSSGIKNWSVAVEPSYYEVKSTGDNTKQGGFTTSQNAVNNYISSNSSIGTCKIYDAILNESLDINAVNFHIEGDGTTARSQTQISKITLNSNSHRITLKNILLGGASSQTPLVIQSSGTLTENGVANIGRGKHILSGISFSTTGTKAIDVVSINNFLICENCDAQNKIIELRDRVGPPILVSFTNCQNGVLIIGNGYIINKFNSPTLTIQSISASSYLLDLDIKKPTGYSLIRLSSALGNTIPIALGQLIINDDVGGDLSNLRCKTAYNVAANLGTGTAIDLTKYDIQIAGAQIDDTTLSTSKVYSSQKIDNTYIQKTLIKTSFSNPILDTNISSEKLVKDNLDLKEDKIVKTGQAKKVVRINATEDGYIFEDLLDSNNLIKSSYISKDLTFEFIIVQDETERFALTTTQVQKNDGVYQEDLKKLFFVIDVNNLNNANGYKESSINIDLTNYYNKTIDTTDNITEGTINQFHTNSRVLSSVLTGISTATNGIKLIATNTIKEGFDLVNKIIDILDLKNDKPTTAIENNISVFNNNRNLKDSSKYFKNTLTGSETEIEKESIILNQKQIETKFNSASFIKYSVIKEQTKTSTFSVPQDLVIFNDVDGFNYGDFLVCKTAYVVQVTASTGTSLDITKYELFRNNKIYNLTAKGNTNELYFAFNRVNSLASNKEDYVFNLKGYFSGETLSITLLNSITKATFNGINSNETIIPANITIAHSCNFVFNNISFIGNLNINPLINSKLTFRDCKFSNLTITSSDVAVNIEFYNCEFTSNVDFIAFIPTDKCKVKFYNCLIPSSLNILQRASAGGSSTTRRLDYYFDIETSRKSGFVFNSYGYPIFNTIPFDLSTSEVYNCFLKRAKQTQFIGEFKDFDKDVSSIYTNLLLADGGTFSATTYPYLYSYYGNSNVKVSDSRGQFPRYKNNSRNDGKQDPDGERTLGSYQADDFKSHYHKQTLGQGVNTGKRWQDNGYYYGQSYGNWIASLPYYDTLCLTENTGGNETRPKNICFVRYIVAGYNFE